ncbi:MAG: HlyD family efflux transporter periplasmic adaptor subunit [Verrucomicrobiae bacterium]|nr:HlyD family efflux transporter periplasmic adaptor subunit [Verrucomicrobiae bacterium]
MEPIPSPPGHLLREFCHRVLPTLAFLGAILASTILWNVRFNGFQIFGEVEPIRANVTAVEGGHLIHWSVERFQPVTNGQILGALQILDPDAIRSELAVLGSELSLMRSRMALDEARNEQNVETMRARWLEARVNLATARVTLENARRDLERNRSLRADRIVSDAEFDLAQSAFDALQAEVHERTRVVEGLEEAVHTLDTTHRRTQGGALDVISEALAAQERLLLRQRDQLLRAPMDGIISVVNHRTGERLVPGSVVAIVAAPTSERILAYVRQPLMLDLKPGMQVQVRTRGRPARTATSHILHIGAEIEPILAPSFLRPFNLTMDHGLAFSVALPPELHVLPGEMVDLTVWPGR